ncbi:MAG: sensor histidine kinase [Chloroflexota bacterium]|nr:sensor histidine kinase [Chloroflexota bacterium]MDE3193143.1 sensor histidine kinase [Chloroflexota bacterium]
MWGDRGIDGRRDAAAARREQELVARFRLRMARAASTIALIVVTVIALYVILQPVQYEPAPRPVLWALLAAAAIVSLAIHRRTRSGAEPVPLSFLYLWTAAVIAFDTAVVYLAGDASSDIYLIYLLVVLFAAATLPTWSAALALAGAVIAYLGILLRLGGDMTDPQIVLRVATFAVVGLLGGYLAREQQREIALRVEHEGRQSDLLARAISAQEGERNRIARELHDGPVQALSAISMQLGLVEEMTPAELAQSRPLVVDGRAALRRTLREVRRITQDLRPSALDDLGLVTAVHDFATRRCDAAGIRLRWEVSGPSRRLAPPVETAVFRILQEGVTNVVRHAHARSARVSIAFVDGHLRAEVEDDGVGFDPDEVVHRARDGGGVGLAGMRERASLLGGTFRVDPAPSGGTHLRAEIPIAHLTAGAAT